MNDTIILILLVPLFVIMAVLLYVLFSLFWLLGELEIQKAEYRRVREQAKSENHNIRFCSFIVQLGNKVLNFFAHIFRNSERYASVSFCQPRAKRKLQALVGRLVCSSNQLEHENDRRWDGGSGENYDETPTSGHHLPDFALPAALGSGDTRGAGHP